MDYSSAVIVRHGPAMGDVVCDFAAMVGPVLNPPLHGVCDHSAVNVLVGECLSHDDVPHRLRCLRNQLGECSDIPERPSVEAPATPRRRGVGQREA